MLAGGEYFRRPSWVDKEPGFYEQVIADQTRIIEDTRLDETLRIESMRC